MSYNLFLDDVRLPNMFLNDTKHWAIVRNYNQFVDLIQKRGLPDFISFDHDLADEHYVQLVDYSQFKEKTGYDCAKWLIEYCVNTKQLLPKYQVHSMNPIGSRNIDMTLMAHRHREIDNS